ncbi:MAG: HAD family hydrolase [Promethearchaeota archaeon]
MVYTAIIFDWGNVLLDFSYDLTFKKWAELTQFDFEFFKTHFKFDKKLVEYEKGDISSEEYFNYITKLLDISWKFEVFSRGWNSIYIGINSQIASLLNRLKKNYKLYLLTNTNELHANCWKKNYPDILKSFDGIFCSHELHSHKPEPKIYRDVLKEIDIDPKYVLFVDDNKENILGAKQVGIDGIVAISAEQIINDMEELSIFQKINK